MDLIVVESPTKAKTISRFLGPQYKVDSSFGHIRDLPKGALGVDVEHDFTPKYVIPTKAKGHVTALRKSAEKASSVILATDEDREGEAIAWHLANALGLDGEQTKRIVFHEITKRAIEEALEHPRTIDMNRVNAQQARRILDRLVGYKLSPFLWKKVVRGLSAGRVQSVAVRLVVEQEREIKNFVPQEYWEITAELEKKTDDTKKSFTARLHQKNNEVVPKMGIKNKEKADSIMRDLEGADYKIVNIEKKETVRNPMPPFTTSALQQAAWQRFRMSAKRTMQLAQQLYEKGYITYHRTDSVNVAKQAIEEANNFILSFYGDKYALEAPRIFKTKSKGAQEAHEAIRPSYPDKSPGDMKSEIEPSEWKLYELIWKRFIACQMSMARFDSTTVDIEAKNYGFRASGLTMKFDGFLKAYPMKFEETDLPLLENNELLRLIKLTSTQRFTKPPARYNDASLVKALEEHGIGRPSTYAPTIDTILKRNYIERDEEKRFSPTEMGNIVTDLLVEHFPQIVDINFTATMEGELDNIAHGETNWVKLLRDFYGPFEENLNKKYEEVAKKETAEKTGEKCPDCAEGDLMIKFGRFGKFIACSRFPECKYTQPILERIGIKCPLCKEGDIVERMSKRRRKFYGCSRWPDCNFALWNKPTGAVCDACNSLMVAGAKNQILCSNKECANSQITKESSSSAESPTAENLPSLDYSQKN